MKLRGLKRPALSLRAAMAAMAAMAGEIRAPCGGSAWPGPGDPEGALLPLRPWWPNWPYWRAMRSSKTPSAWSSSKSCDGCPPAAHCRWVWACAARFSAERAMGEVGSTPPSNTPSLLGLLSTRIVFDESSACPMG